MGLGLGSGRDGFSERSIELKPNYVIAHQWYSEFLGVMGRHEDRHRRERAPATNSRSARPGRIASLRTALCGRVNTTPRRSSELEKTDALFPILRSSRERATLLSLAHAYWLNSMRRRGRSKSAAEKTRAGDRSSYIAKARWENPSKPSAVIDAFDELSDQYKIPLLPRLRTTSLLTAT